MSSAKAKEPNPLFSQNIPPPPSGVAAVPPGVAAAPTSVPVSEPENGKTVKQQSGNGASEDQGRMVERLPRTSEKRQPAAVPVVETDLEEEAEKATIELSLYLRPSQDDKLEELRRAYKRRMRKKISANEIMRRLIDTATLEMLIRD